MSRFDKELARLKSEPKDFTYNIIKPYIIKAVLNSLKEWRII